ncbi:RNA polymerase sigma factor [Patescibacteria group bacterium]
MKKTDNLDKKTDEELVTLTLRDKAHFGFLIDRYESKIFRYIRRITNVPQEEVEDILQESFLKAYINLNDFDLDLKFSSWIYRITRNQVISTFRKSKVRPEGNYIDVEDESLYNIISDSDIEKDIDLQILRKNINKVLNYVEERYREVLVLKFLEGKDYREMSDILKKPMGTIATHINRGKQQFREEIEKLKIEL